MHVSGLFALEAINQKKYNGDPSFHLHIHLANASETTCMQYLGVRRRMAHIVQNAT